MATFDSTTPYTVLASAGSTFSDTIPYTVTAPGGVFNGTVAYTNAVAANTAKVYRRSGGSLIETKLGVRVGSSIVWLSPGP